MGKRCMEEKITEEIDMYIDHFITPHIGEGVETKRFVNI